MKAFLKLFKTLKFNKLNFLIVSMFLSSIAFGQTTYTWDCSTLGSTTGINSNITSANFVNPQGNNNGTTTQITALSVSTGYSGASGTSNFGAASFTGALSTTTTTYFSTVITPTSGYGIQLNSISFGSRSTATGPLLVSVYSSIDNYASAIGTATVANNSSWTLSTVTFSTGLIGLANTPVTLRLYGSGGGGTPAINTANWRIDDIKLSVTPVTPPTITSLSTTAGCIGQSLTITGTNLAGATAANVKIGGISVSSITSNSGTSMVVVVGTACSGTVVITTLNGTGTSSGTYTAGATAIYNLGWVSGINPDSTKAIIFQSDFTASSNISGCSCSITNGNVVIPSSFNLTLLNEINVTNNAATSFILENNASLIQINPSSGINNGNITLKRNSSSLYRLDYTLWSSPVTGMQTLKSFSPNTLNNRFYTYSTATDFYSIVPSVAIVPFETGKGYLIRMPDNHPDVIAAPLGTIWNGQFTGIPNNGTQTITVSDAFNGFNAIGNPYPSPISINDFVTANATKIDQTIYFWRKTNSVTTNSGYCSYNNGTNVFSNNTSPISSNGQDPLGVLQTGQGFMVKALPGASSVIFTNAMRIINNANQFFKTNDERHTIWLNVTGENDMFSQTAVGYRSNALDNEDYFDAIRLNDSQISLSSYLNNKNFVIQAKALPFSTQDVIPLILKVTTDGNYNIAIDHLDGLFNTTAQAVYLHDLYNNTYSNLKLGSYNFATIAGTFNNRFEITFNTTLSTPINAINQNSLIVFKKNGEIVVHSNDVAIKSIKIYDLQGRLLFDKSDINETEFKLNVGSENQIVLVKTTLINGQISAKKLVN